MTGPPPEIATWEQSRAKQGKVDQQSKELTTVTMSLEYAREKIYKQVHEMHKRDLFLSYGYYIILTFSFKKFL